MNNLQHYGIKNMQVTDLVHPDMPTAKESKYSRCLIPKEKHMEGKNQSWLKKVKKCGYKNQRYLERREIIPTRRGYTNRA